MAPGPAKGGGSGGGGADVPFSLRDFRALAAELMAEDPSLAAALDDDAASPEPPPTKARGAPSTISKVGPAAPRESLSPAQAGPRGKKGPGAQGPGPKQARGPQGQGGLHARMGSADLGRIVGGLMTGPEPGEPSRLGPGASPAAAGDAPPVPVRPTSASTATASGASAPSESVRGRLPAPGRMGSGVAAAQTAMRAGPTAQAPLERGANHEVSELHASAVESGGGATAQRTEGPTPPASIRRLYRGRTPSSGESEMNAALAQHSQAQAPWGTAAADSDSPKANGSYTGSFTGAPPAGATAGPSTRGGSEVLTLDDSESNLAATSSITGTTSTATAGTAGTAAGTAAGAPGTRPRTGLHDRNARSFFAKAEETYSLQVAVALRLLGDSDLAEETEMATPSAAAAPEMLWAEALMPRTQAEATAYRFWVNGALSYEDRIEDGFYDIWGMQPYVYSLCVDPSQRGRMPQLDALRSLNPTEATFDVALINRSIDLELKDMEDEAVSLAYAATEVQTLAQKLGVLVAQRMGGPTVSEPNELVPRFRQRGWEIKSYLKTVVLPIGRLPVGLCRHRALLFKVLADALGMPCRIMRGCKFCQMDDGASCLVLANDDREYIVDLLEKPGTLLPIEPSPAQAAAAAAAAGTGGAGPGDAGAGRGTTADSTTTLMVLGTYISSPLQCPRIKSLALTDPSDGAPAWIPDFRRVDDEAESKYASRRGHPGKERDGRAGSPKRRGRGAQPDAVEEGEEEDTEEEEEEEQKEKKKKKKPAKKFADEKGKAGKGGADAADDAPESGDKAAVLVVDEERGADIMDVLLDGRIMDLGDAEIPWEDIELGERVGAGSFGTVYRGEWAGSDVAVKVLINQDLQEEQLDEFKREVVIMRRLRHPNIVLFMGAVTKPPNLSIVTEFLARGSLFRLLHRPGAKDTLREDRRMRMAMDIARGINYLHHCNPMIVHRDLKTPNLLVDKNFTVKVADFGLSRNKNSTFLSSKSGAGTPEWMAPEVLRNEPSDEKSDVYSFGVILWELATLLQPWDGMNPMQVVGAVGFQHQRLSVPPELDANLAQLILDCWHEDPKDRPNFNAIMARLKPIAQKMGAMTKAV